MPGRPVKGRLANTGYPLLQTSVVSLTFRYHPGSRCQGTGATAAEARPRHVDKRVRADDCNSSPAVDVEAAS